MTNKHVYNARFDIFIAVAVTINVFWDMTPCPLVHSFQMFRRMSMLPDSLHK
jgi:hypothetical protein